MRIPLSALILLLALAGCGAKPTPAATAPDEHSTAIAIAPDQEPSPPGEGDGITAIDAATGDAKAMPADSFAPSAYDLAQRAERAKAREAQREMRAVPAARLGAPADLLAGDESVSTGD